MPPSSVQRTQGRMNREKWWRQTKRHTQVCRCTQKNDPQSIRSSICDCTTSHPPPHPQKTNNPPKPKIKHRIESPHKFNKKASEVWRLCLKRRVQSIHSIHFYDRNTQEDWTNMDTGIRVKVHRYTYRYHHYNNKRRYASTYTGKDFGCSDNKCPLSSPVSRMWTGLYAKSVVTSAGAGHALVSLQPIVHLLHMGAVATVTRLKTQVHDVVIVYPPFESYIGAEAQWLPNYTQATAWKSFWRKLLRKTWWFLCFHFQLLPLLYQCLSRGYVWVVTPIVCSG